MRYRVSMPVKNEMVRLFSSSSRASNQLIAYFEKRLITIRDEVDLRLQPKKGAFWVPEIAEELDHLYKISPTSDSAPDNAVRLVHTAPFSAPRLVNEALAAQRNSEKHTFGKIVCSNTQTTVIDVDLAPVLTWPFAPEQKITDYVTPEAAAVLKELWTICPAES